MVEHPWQNIFSPSQAKGNFFFFLIDNFVKNLDYMIKSQLFMFDSGFLPSDKLIDLFYDDLLYWPLIMSLHTDYILGLSLNQ